MLILSLSTWLNSYINSSSFCVESLQFSIYGIIFHLYKKTLLPLPFQFGSLLLFSWLFSVARTSNTMLDRSGESEHSCLIQDFSRKAFSSSTLSVLLAMDLSYMVFIMLRYTPSIRTFIGVFTMNGCWNLSNDFSVFIEMIMWFLSFLLLVWYITLMRRCWTILASLELIPLDYDVWSF